LRRHGDVTVRFAAEMAAGREDLEKLRRTLVRKFSAVFPDELHFDGLTPPNGGALGKLQSLVLHDFYCDRGWLVLGYELDAPSAPSTSKVAGIAASDTPRAK
jgi:hypothetical protein